VLLKTPRSRYYLVNLSNKQLINFVLHLQTFSTFIRSIDPFDSFCEQSIFLDFVHVNLLLAIRFYSYRTYTRVKKFINHNRKNM